jgi:hypothetical protein
MRVAQAWLLALIIVSLAAVPALAQTDAGTLGEKAYLPLGGGIQKTLNLGSVEMELAARYFRNVVRPSKGTVRDLRFLAKLSF